MKNNKTIKILVALIAAALVLAVIIVAVNKSKVDDNTTAATSLTTTADVAEITSAQSETEEISDESTTQTSAKEAEPAFIKSGNWYLFDKADTACYVFSFDGKGNVDLAMFDSSNIEDGDPQYFKGYASYKADKDKVVIEKLPSAVKLEKLTFDIKDKSLLYNGKKLDNHKNVSVDYAFEYFGTI